MKILLVDANPEVERVLCAFLRMNGIQQYIVHWARDLFQAEFLIIEETYQIIVLDEAAVPAGAHFHTCPFTDIPRAHSANKILLTTQEQIVRPHWAFSVWRKNRLASDCVQADQLVQYPVEQISSIS